MKRQLVFALIALVAVTGCSLTRKADREDPYANPFYARYLNTGTVLDDQIRGNLAALQQTPADPVLHNELGTLLVQKGFPKDAEREFERAINLDGDYYPAWYNLGLVRASRGDDLGANRAFAKTIRLKPGHAAALFQMGLVEEKRHHIERAVEYYAKAYRINPSLLEVDVNPRIVESKLTHLALIQTYPNAQNRNSMHFDGAPTAIRQPQAIEAPSHQAAPQDIVTPAPPATDPSMQSTPAPEPQPRPRRRNRRSVEEAPVVPEPVPPPAATAT